jgi:CheY-specific phosphatase CheX
MKKYIQPCITASQSVLCDFVGIEAAAGKPRVVKEIPWEEWDICARIDYSGGCRGGIALAMKKDLAVHITDNVLKTNPVEIDEDVREILRELINIIAGHIKGSLPAKKNVPVTLSLPNVDIKSISVSPWPPSYTIAEIPFSAAGYKDFRLFLSFLPARRQLTGQGGKGK